MEQKQLTINQEKFAQEYILTGNASEAYRRAYPKSLKWKDNAVQVAGSKLLANPIVSVRVEELRVEVKEKFDISTERLLLEQSRIALFDFRRLFDENGNMIKPKDMPDEVAAAVSSVKVSNRSLGEGEGFETITELKLWNKNTSLDSLFKNKGLYEVDNKQNGANALAEALLSMAATIDGKSKGLPNG
ncbi:MAG TPA: hypothetical protein DCS09_09790 [Porphyromonadaceae bacterium]|nr:hypothetical protein [Porphyromonadaceae bacterium]